MMPTGAATHGPHLYRRLARRDARGACGWEVLMQPLSNDSVVPTRHLSKGQGDVRFGARWHT